jgi:oligopeptidase B
MANQPTRRQIHTLALAGLTTSLMNANDASPPKLPVAKIVPKSIVQHGQTRIDNYAWLRDDARKDPEVLAYLEAENQYFETVTKPTAPLQATLYGEMVGRIQETDLSVPVRIDDHYYYTRTEKGKNYQIYCRKYETLDAEEQLVLDANELAAGHDYFRLGNYTVSPNHKLLAYSTDTAGNEVYLTQFKNLETGALLPDRVPNVYYGIYWANDNQTLFYSVLDAAKRPYRIYRHKLGEDPAEDLLVYEETDAKFTLSLRKTRDRKYILLVSKSSTTSEVSYIDADAPSARPSLLAARRQGIEYSVGHHEGRFLIRTNENAQNFKLMEAKVGDTAPEKWRELLPHRANVLLEGADEYREWLVLAEREDGLRHMRVRRWDGSQDHRVGLPEPVYSLFPQGNPNYTASTIRFTYQSLVTPSSVFDYDMPARQRKVLKEQEIPSGYDRTQYISERLFATAADGAKVPVAIVYKKGFRKDGKAPVMLYAYGSYGANTEATFSTTRLSLLDRGFAWAIANIRGGSEMGRAWYETGKLLHKKNTFTDFIACAEHLIGQKYTSPSRLAIMGGSAGGLLMGAVLNLRPELFHTALALVPFVDVVNSMSDATLPLTTGEYEEWGNPADKKFFDYILSYSPYENTGPRHYPNLFVTGGLNDPRVPYWEPAKWVAKLRAVKKDKNLLVMKMNMGAGHFGRSGRYEALRETAEQYAFLLMTMGIRE